MPQQPYFYGGQAVIEGVMIRGQRFFSLAVRRMNGSIYHSAEPLSSIYTGRMRLIPLARGIVVLIETLTLGFKVLTRSANIALEDKTDGETEEISGWLLFTTLSTSLAIGIGLFFLLPLFAARSLDPILDSWIGARAGADFISNILEGLLRLGLLIGYITAIGMQKDVRRVFAYHGAEHMTIHAFEHGLPLEVAKVRPFPTAHPRCGTAFLLTVAIVSILIFAILGRPDIQWAILSRIVLIPIIAGISYEILRYSGAHSKTPLATALSAPGMLLQRLTTRRPDDSQIEVAIQAMKVALAADEGIEYTPEQGAQTQSTDLNP